LLVVGIVLLLAIFGWAAGEVVGLVGDTIDAGLGPVRALSDSVSTQVANVLHPTPTIIPDPVTVVHEVRSLARLETIQYSVEKVISAESSQGPFGFLFGDKLLFIAHGTVIAGVDLEKLNPEDLWTENGVLYVRLPAAEIFIATLDNDKSYIYDRDKGLLTKGNDQLETAARQAAVEEFTTSAIDDGILDQAQVNAENYLYRLLTQLGFPEVIFVDAASIN